MQWKWVPTNQLVINKMNELEGSEVLWLADLAETEEVTDEDMDTTDHLVVASQKPPINPNLPAARKELALDDTDSRCLTYSIKEMTMAVTVRWKKKNK
jgi:hypothetical protein